MTNKEICRRVLFAGPDRRSHGGVAYVVGIYEQELGCIAYLPTTDYRNKLLGALRFALSLALLPFYRLRGYRLLHAHGSIRGSWTRKILMLRWARFLGMHTVHHIHSGNLGAFLQQKGLDKAKRQLAKSDAVVALSNHWLQYMREELGLKNAILINNPISRPAIVRQHAYDGNRPLRLIFLSGIARPKGIFELLEALHNHRAELAGKVRLDIYGSGIDEPRLLKYLNDNNFSDIVDFHGYADGEIKQQAFAAADVFVLPSYAEGMPISMLEAMAAGLAVIVTPVGGIPDAVTDGRNGLLIPPKDSEAIFTAIKQLLVNPESVDHMGATNAQAAGAFFSDSIAASLSTLYASLLSKS